jgi:hypothetical protein
MRMVDGYATDTSTTNTHPRFLNVVPFLSVLLGGPVPLTFSLKVSAITAGQLGGADHPYVAMVVAYFDYVDEAGTGVHMPLRRGSGTLISPRVVVTAGHAVGVEVGQVLFVAGVVALIVGLSRVGLPYPKWA